jgi:glycosyltransferase involved in cell wall biosynthesis
MTGLRGLTERGNPLLFIVTNPPLAPLLGFVAKKLKGQRYVLLFYDVYPEALVRFGGVSDQSVAVGVWRFLNRLAIRNADRVITISPQMARTLLQYCSDVSRRPQIDIVPTWVDTDRIRPLPKGRNWFATQNGQTGKLTILYSGNLGRVHDLTMLPETADRLRDYSDIHFLIIGEGPGRKSVELQCGRLGLENVSFLPLQDEATLPWSLAAGDIGIVALADGAEGISMPSKTYYMMAAGNALLGLSRHDSELAAVIRDYKCGVNVAPRDVDGVVRAILELRDQPAILQRYRDSAREAAEQHFSLAVGVPKMLELVGELI